MTEGTWKDTKHAAQDGWVGRARMVGRDLLSNAWARLERVSFDYRRGDGGIERQVREVYHRGHGAAILLHDASRDTVVLVRQFRLPVLEVEHGAFGPGPFVAARGRSGTAGDAADDPDGPGFLLEVPAGVLDGESPATRVRAEVAEETGYRIGEPDFLFAAYVSPGSVTELIHYFVAPYAASDRTEAGGGVAAEGEDIEVVEMTLDAALDAVATGRIRDAKTLVLLQHAALVRRRGPEALHRRSGPGGGAKRAGR